MKKKHKQIKRKDIEEFLRERLDKKGFKMNHPSKKVSSVDIIAQKDKMLLYFSTLGLNEDVEKTEKDFFKVFFDAFTHLENQYLQYSIIAMPIEFYHVLKKSLDKRKSAWVRVCIAFPELRLYFIDLDEKKVNKKKLIEIINDDEEI